MSADVARYRALRAEGWRPADAVQLARRPAPKVLNWDDEGVYLTVDGWDVAISVEKDHEYGPELGTFDDVADPDALDLGPHNPGWRYFHPQTSYRAHRAALHRIGHARHAADCRARRYVHDDMFTQLGVINQPWLVSVVVSLADVDFGFAAAGGVVLGRDGVMVDDAVNHAFNTGMVDQALAMAQAKLEEVQVAGRHLRLVR